MPYVIGPHDLGGTGPYALFNRAVALSQVKDKILSQEGLSKHL